MNYIFAIAVFHETECDSPIWSLSWCVVCVSPPFLLSTAQTCLVLLVHLCIRLQHHNRACLHICTAPCIAVRRQVHKICYSENSHIWILQRKWQSISNHIRLCRLPRLFMLFKYSILTSFCFVLANVAFHMRHEFLIDLLHFNIRYSTALACFYHTILVCISTYYYYYNYYHLLGLFSFCVTR